jgi:hypothetical protein
VNLVSVSLSAALLFVLMASCGKGGDKSGEFFGTGGGSAAAAPGGFAASVQGSGAGTGSGSGSGSGSAAGSGAGSGSALAGAGSGAGSDSMTGTEASDVQVPPELAAIKITLAKNWLRDATQAGTFSIFLPLSASGQGEDTTFIFQYGIEPSSAPTEREAYKAWLGTQKIMNVEKDRQRGSTWFLEGTDMSGGSMFRSFVNYGGKIVWCGGSGYKDADSSKLGKLRDEVLIQAKLICESVTM